MSSPPYSHFECNMKDHKPDTELTDKEEEIMLLFWNNGELKVKDLLDIIPEPKPHVNTVSTFVRSLEAKGYLGHYPKGTGFVYFPIKPMEEYRRGTFGKMIRSFFSNSYMKAVSALVEDEKLSAEELRELLNMVEKGKKTEK